MRRLSNAQMNILAERVTDLLEEAGKESRAQILESDEYRNFEKTYSDETLKDLKILAEQEKKFIDQKEAAEQELERVRRATKDCLTQAGKQVETYRTYYPGREVTNYLENKKNEKFSASMFNRDKILRKVQADILLSDVDNPEELVRSLVDKLK